jgi:hypothetical protein
MNPQTKKNIKLLCDRFLHNINYERDDLLIYNSINEIRVTHLRKNTFQIKYNCLFETDVINLEEEEIYDVLIQIFQRKTIKKVTKSRNEIITLEVLKEEEYFTEKRLKSLIEELKHLTQDYKNLGGNRI